MERKSICEAGNVPSVAVTSDVVVSSSSRSAAIQRHKALTESPAIASVSSLGTHSVSPSRSQSSRLVTISEPSFCATCYHRRISASTTAEVRCDLTTTVYPGRHGLQYISLRLMPLCSPVALRTITRTTSTANPTAANMKFTGLIAIAALAQSVSAHCKFTIGFTIQSLSSCSFQTSGPPSLLAPPLPPRLFVSPSTTAR
jgi:hypothetical protein